MTNEEKIKSMSREEMAEAMAGKIFGRELGEYLTGK